MKKSLILSITILIIVLFVSDIYTKEKTVYKNLKWGMKKEDVQNFIDKKLSCSKDCCTYEDKIGL